jgi:adenylate cyclase
MNGKYERALDVLLMASSGSYTGGDRLFIAMTLAELGRLEEARSGVRNDFLVNTYYPWMNLAFLRHHWAHWREEDLECLLDALRMAGMPEWPTGYDTTSWERLDEAAITALLFGRVWFGRNQNYYGAFVQRTGTSGDVVYGIFGRQWEGKVSVKGDSLCYQIPALLLSRKFCGTVYRNPDGSPEQRNEYVSVDVFDVHHFSLKEWLLWVVRDIRLMNRDDRNVFSKRFSDGSNGLQWRKLTIWILINSSANCPEESLVDNLKPVAFPQSGHLDMGSAILNPLN